MKLLLVVFAPFAAGYFLSFFFRNVNAVISKDLAREFSLAPSDLGLLTSMYLLAFAAFQLPLGVLLDRYGPRRVVAALMCVAAAGALTFALAQDFTQLAIGRALLGPFGWRALFLGLAAFSLLVAVVIFTVVPEKELPGRGATLREQFAAFGEIFASAPFWRIAAALVVTHATYHAMQGLWLGPWLYDVAGMERPAVATFLLVTALAYTAGSVFFGVTGDRLARAGISRMTTLKAGLVASFAMFALLGAGVQQGLGAVLALYGFTIISGALAYPLMTALFAPEMTGRVNTASNVLMFGCAFAFQWGIGAVLRLFPAAGDGYAPQGYAAAFLIFGGLQLATIAWLLPMREPRGYARL